MTCAEFESRLSAYLDGELSRWKRWKVQNHVHHCTECREVLEDLQTVDLCLVSNVAASSAPEYLTAAVLHRLPAMPPAWRRHGSVLPWAAGLAVAGMQAAALCGAYWWGFHRGTVTGAPDRTSVVSGATLPRVRVSRPESDSGGDVPANSSPQPGVWSFPAGSTTFALPSPVLRAGSGLSTFPPHPAANSLFAPSSNRPAASERPLSTVLRTGAVSGGN